MEDSSVCKATESFGIGYITIRMMYSKIEILIICYQNIHILVIFMSLVNLIVVAVCIYNCKYYDIGMNIAVAKLSCMSKMTF